jgi:chromate transporter
LRDQGKWADHGHVCFLADEKQPEFYFFILPSALILSDQSMKADPAKSHPLIQVAGLFLKLGLIGFGGPAAHIAMMEEEVVRKRGWLKHEDFLDLLGATNLIPGPNSTEMAIHIGRRRAGWPGLIVAGVCFILPAMLLVMVCAWAYTRFGKLPEVEGILYGIKPVIIAVVAQALWTLGKTALKTTTLTIVASTVFALSFIRVNELILLFAAGLVLAAFQLTRRTKGKLPLLFFPVPALRPFIAAAAPVSATASAVTAFGLWQ